MKLSYTHPARNDLDRILEHVAVDNPAAATRLVARLIEAIDALATTPDMGRVGRKPGTRELVISGTRYLAVYRRRGEAVEVLRVLHGRRLWP